MSRWIFRSRRCDAVEACFDPACAAQRAGRRVPLEEVAEKRGTKSARRSGGGSANCDGDWSSRFCARQRDARQTPPPDDRYRSLPARTAPAGRPLPGSGIRSGCGKVWSYASLTKEGRRRRMDPGKVGGAGVPGSACAPCAALRRPSQLLFWGGAFALPGGTEQSRTRGISSWLTHVALRNGRADVV